MSTTNKNEKDTTVSIKVPQQIERIKKQEDEEQWISGEELCTEGSSEDEDPLHSHHQLPKTTVTTPKKMNRQRKNKKFTHTAQAPLVKRSVPKRPSPLIKDSTPALLIPPIPPVVDDDDEVNAIANKLSTVSTTDELTTPVKEDEREFKLMIEMENHSYNKVLENLKSLREISERPLKVNATSNALQQYEEQRNAYVNELQNAKTLMDQLDKEIIKVENDVMNEFKSRIEEEKEICEIILNCDVNNKKIVEVNQRYLKLCRTNTMQETENKNKKTIAKKSKWATIRKISTAVKKVKSEPIISKNIKLLNYKKSVIKSKSIIDTPLTPQQKERLAILLADLDEDEEEKFGEDSSAVSNNELNKCKKVIPNEKNETIVEKNCNQNESKQKVEMEIAFRFNNEIEKRLSSIDEKLKEYQTEFPQSEILENILKHKPTSKINTGQAQRNLRRDLKSITNDMKKYQQKYSVSEVEPLTDEQMSTLLKSCIKSLKNTMKISSENEPFPSVHLSPDTREKLLHKAKLDIPKFKYKYKSEFESDNIEKGEKELKDSKENRDNVNEKFEEIKYYENDDAEDITSTDFDTESESDDCIPFIRSVLSFLDDNARSQQKNFYYNPKPKLLI